MYLNLPMKLRQQYLVTIFIAFLRWQPLCYAFQSNNLFYSKHYPQYGYILNSKSYSLSASIIIIPLLMPKVIQPRRHDKELTVEEFWKIKNEAKTQKAVNVFHAYREDEVEQRHRFAKPSDEAKTFNPLSYILKKENRIESNELYIIGTEDENTYVAEYLKNVQNKVHSSIYEVKKLLMGHQSIIYNLQPIYSVLLKHLDLEQTWPLLQAVIKDSRAKNIHFWLQSGFQQIAQSLTQQCSTNFNKPFFKNVFDTLCIFMQIYYDQILINLIPFFRSFGQQFMKHTNKYVRKFSIQAFSYILSNLQQDKYDMFLRYLVEIAESSEPAKIFFDQKVRLGDILLQRLKIVKGCLTTASLANFIAQIQTIQQILFKNNPQNNSNPFFKCVPQYIGLVLDSLNCKQGADQNQILFDFVYVLKALMKFSQKDVERYGEVLLSGFSNYLQVYHTDKKRFSPHTRVQSYYLKQVWSTFADFFKNNLQYRQNTHLSKIIQAVAVLTIKCGSQFLHNAELMAFINKEEQSICSIIKCMYQHDEPIQSNLVEIVLLLSKKIIQDFILHHEDIQYSSNNQNNQGNEYPSHIYSLIILIKRFQINKLIDFNWLQIDHNELYPKIKQSNLQNELIVTLRLYTHLKFSQQIKRQMSAYVQQCYKQQMDKYQKYIKNILALSINKTNASLHELYDYNNFTKEIIIYSHHEIQWLGYVFNAYQAFAFLYYHIGKPMNQTSAVWDQLIMSRPLALNILSFKGLFQKDRANSLILNLLSSRNREVRHHSLLIVSKQYDNASFQTALIDWLLAIDKEPINLDNQRQVKRIFTNAEQYVSNLSQENRNSPSMRTLYEILIKWCLGFAFTGFKLIQNAFISFLKCLIDTPLHFDIPSIIQANILPFLQYYNYRHSRQYEFDVSDQAPVTHLTKAFKLPQLKREQLPFIQQDLQITNLDTVQWIGLERIVDAIRASSNGKKYLGQGLLNIVQAYFNVQFKRQAHVIQTQRSVFKPFLLPIKQRFLVNILKLCPHNYLPPYQCLHFTRQIYFELQGVKNIKRNNWQQMWQSKKGDQAKKKVEITDLVSTTVNLEHLSTEEQIMYINYLWKDIMQSNRHKKRIIMDHIRNYLPSATSYIFTLLFEYLHISQFNMKQIDEATINNIVARLRLMNRKTLLNGMFILKSLLIHLRQEVNQQGRLKLISLFILSLIQIVYTSGEEVVNEEDQEQSEKQEQEEQGNKDYFQYKQHRKQLQKLLQTLFANHYLEVDNISDLLEFLFINTKINLAKSSRLSLPGLLLIIKTISAQKQYGLVLMKVLNGQIISMLTEMIRADDQNERPLKSCYQIWLQIMFNLIIRNEEESSQTQNQIQTYIQQQMVAHTSSILSAVLSYINAGDSRFENAIETKAVQMRKKEQESIKLLRVITKLLQIHNGSLQVGWQNYIWQEINKLTKLKRNMNQTHCQRLGCFIEILGRYIKLTQDNIANKQLFLKKIIGVLPSIRDLDQRLHILQIMISKYEELGLSVQIVEIARKMNLIKKTALIVTMDFTAFFEACNDYTLISNSIRIIDHEFFLCNLVCFTDNAQLSVRRAVSNGCKHFLQIASQKIKQASVQDEKGHESISFVCLKIYKVFLDMLSKQNTQRNQAIYWSVIENIDLFLTWISTTESLGNFVGYPNVHTYSLFNIVNDQGKSCFKLLASLSESNKLKGLTLLRTAFQNMAAQNKLLILQFSDISSPFPNPLERIVLPLLEYFIFKPTQTNHNHESIKSNLASTFAKTSLEMLPLISGFLKQRTLKRYLKKLISKLKFTDSENKKNIALIKMIGGLIDGAVGERVNDKLNSYLQEHGFEQFHQKITQFSKSNSHQTNIDQHDDDDYDYPNNPSKKQKIPDYFDRLQELESDQAINRNFLHFDKKLMEIQEEQNQENIKEFPLFLKKHVLLPLRTMLMMENKGKADQQNSKSQILLSVTITKVLLKLPLDTFLRQFQKVINRLGRLLKKRQIQVRDNSRNCLCQIAKAVGPQLLYAIIIQLKFHLKDNFDRHVLNYSLAKILQSINLSSGQLDYCLPLILPSVIDQIFGQSANEKDLVQKRQVRTLKYEAKKQKGLEILQVVCKHISAHRIGFIIEYLEKYLREHLVTQVNLGKYDHMLGAITSGLAHNLSALNNTNASLLLPILAAPVTKLRQQIKHLTWDDSAKHENTLKGDWKRRKAGKQQILSLQEEAGRNGSIFKKMSKQIGEKRNLQIIASSLIQFYLALLSFFLKRQVFTLNSITADPELSSHFLTLLSFLGECVDQRDNRLVTKSLKTLHIALSWKTQHLKGDLQVVGDRFRSIKKQTSRKILLLVQQLTLADQQLLKQCFIFLNDLISQASITLQMLPNFISVIKLHTPTTQDQPHLPQTYQLLRTLLYKCPQFLFYPLLDEMHNFVRMQLPTCRNKEIRDLACSILSVYLRPKKDIQPSVDSFNISQKKHGKPIIDYNKRLQQQLTFYLSNLQCSGQQGILSLLQQFVDNRQGEQIQIFSELLLLGLMTARTNQIQKESQHASDKLIIKILNSINPSKIVSLVEKCLLWISQQRFTSVRLCGVSFLRIIAVHSPLKISNNFIQKYIFGKDGLIQRASHILQEEVTVFESIKVEEKQSQKIDNKWNDIIDKMQVQNRKYQCDPSIIEMLLLLSHFFDNAGIANSGSNKIVSIIHSSWKLLHSKDLLLVQSTINCITKIQLLPSLASYSEENANCFQDAKHSFSLKKIVSSLIFNNAKAEVIQKLLVKIVTEQKQLQMGIKHLSTISWFFVGMALKAHIKSIVYQTVLPTIIYLLNHVTLLRQQDTDFRSLMFAQPNFQDKLFELTFKLGSNNLITSESKALVQETTDILKQMMGVSEYFKCVGQHQVKKRLKKSQQKVRIAQMAILNPVQFVDQKRGRGRKLNQ